MNTGKRAKQLLPNWEELQKAWIERMTGLVDQVEEWAKELDWRTRRILKTLKDSRIGDHQVPGLLMQHEYTQTLLDPMGASAPGVSGIVHFYILPAYDDIAHVFFRTGEWWVEDGFDLNRVPLPEEDFSRPFTRERFGELLQEMKKRDEAYQPV